MDLDLRERREAVVREHMESENQHDFETTLGTFEHPRYEIVPTGDVFDGAEAVRGYFEDSRTAFPDQRNELIALHHADDGVIVEFDLKGTHRGPLRGSRRPARSSPAAAPPSSCSTATSSSASGSTSTPPRSWPSSA